jgi:DNA-binding MarR family transcriptional regulator
MHIWRMSDLSTKNFSAFDNFVKTRPSGAPLETFSLAAIMHTLNKSLGFLLNRAGVAVGNAFSQELKMSSMTLSMWRVLAALHDTGHQNLSGLADFINVEISTLSRQVATLTGRGLVSSGPSGADWRSIEIRLTPAGRAVVQRLLPAVERHERAALAGISAAEAQYFKDLLEKIYNNLCALDTVVPIISGENSVD